MRKISTSLPEVLFVLPLLEPSGAERIVAELASRLPEHGFATSVLCLEDPGAPVGAELTSAGIPVTGLHLSRRRTLACSTAIRKFLPGRRPLIIHAHLFHANIAVRLAVAQMKEALRKDLLVLSTVHVVERRFRPWQFALDRITARYACTEVCVSKAVAQFHQSKTGLPAQFFYVIENGVDVTRFSPPAVKQPFSSRKIHVLAVGRLDPQKDYETLLKAWQCVERAFPAAELSIAGDGPDGRKLRECCIALKLQRVHFMGFVKDVPTLMRASDVFVQSSAWEGFGLTVVEAMACGLPVVVTDVDSLPEIIKHEKTGIVVAKGEPQILADALLKLLRDSQRARTLGLAARADAVARFSVERMVAEYAGLYRKLLQG